MLDGSWLMAQGSWLMAKGGQGRLMAHGQGPARPRGPKGTFNTLRLVGRKLLSNIMAAVIAFLAAVVFV